MRKKGEGLSPLLLQDKGGRNEEEAAAAAIIFWSAKENITAEKTGKGWLVGMGGVGCCFTISPLSLSPSLPPRIALGSGNQRTPSLLFFRNACGSARCPPFPLPATTAVEIVNDLPCPPYFFGAQKGEEKGGTLRGGRRGLAIVSPPCSLCPRLLLPFPPMEAVGGKGGKSKGPPPYSLLLFARSRIRLQNCFGKSHALYGAGPGAKVLTCRSVSKSSNCRLSFQVVNAFRLAPIERKKRYRHRSSSSCLRRRHYTR